MSAAEEEPGAPAQHPALTAIDQLRAVTKWLIAAFAAIGATLVAGSQLSEIGELEGLRLVGAFGGIALGLAGVSLAIWYAAQALMPSHLTLAQLARDEEKSAAGKLVREDPDILVLEDVRTIAQLKQRRDDVLEKDHRAWAAYEVDKKNPQLKEAAAQAQAERKLVDDAVQQFLPIGLYADARAKFTRALAIMFAGALITAGGIGLFAWAAHPEDGGGAAAAEPAAPKEPTEVTVELSPEGRELLGARLGEDCDTTSLSGLAIGGTPDALDVAVLPQDGCQSIRLTLTGEVGTAISTEQVETVEACQRENPTPPCIFR